VKRILTALVMAGAVLSGAAPAFAIETTTFGIDVAEESEDGRLHIQIKAGESTTGRLRVWNKQATPLTLVLSVFPARVDDNGQATLGGEEEATEWVAVEPSRVELDPGASQTIEVRVDAPRKLDREVRTVAVLAQPDTGGEQAPAVLQRLAVTTFLEPDEDSLIASLGPFPWIAAAVLLVVLALLGRRMASRRSAGSSEPPARS
jgi:hypothetical protein